MLFALTLFLIQEGAQEGGGRGPFTINPGLIIWTLVVFGILLVLLWRFAFPAVLKSGEERERRIQKQLEDAQKAHTAAQPPLGEHKKQNAAGRTAAPGLLATAKN